MSSHQHGRPRSRTPNVFISHSSLDRELAEGADQELQRHGCSTLVAYRDIPSGASYAEWIANAILAADAVLLLLSEAAVASPHVAREMNFAIESSTRIVAVTRNASYLIPTRLPPQWRYWLGTVQISVLSSNLKEFDEIAHQLVDPSATPEPPPPRHRLPPTTAGPRSEDGTHQQAIKSLLIRAGDSGLTVTQVVQRARRVGIARPAVLASLPDLRDAHLITYDGDLTDSTEIRLT